MKRQFKFLAHIILLISISSTVSFAQISMSHWHMHKGKGVIQLAGTGIDLQGKHGNPVAYELAEIPYIDDSGWEILEGEINMKLSTDPALKECYQAVDFTYFYALIDIPENTEIKNLKVTLGFVDDGARMFIYNDKHPDGKFDPATDGRYMGPNFTVDFTGDAIPGLNAIAIVQMDDCPVRNQLKNGVKVELNGQVIQPNSALDDPTTEIEVGGNPDKAELGGYYYIRNKSEAEQNYLTSREDSGGGAAYLDVYGTMSDEPNPALQEWLITPAGNGYYKLYTGGVYDAKRALDGNFTDEYSRTGAYGIAPKDTPSQLWQITLGEDGYYRLKTKEQGDSQCLSCKKQEGNCQVVNSNNQATQLWNLEFIRPE